jgi:hypothetical protein
MATYNNNSPYYKTPITAGGYLDVLSFRNIPSEVDDVLYEVSPRYQHRPDLLSYDTYSTVDYWWVFAVRNKTIIKDPIFDLTAGKKIYLPKITTIRSALGS